MQRLPPRFASRSVCLAAPLAALVLLFGACAGPSPSPAPRQREVVLDTAEDDARVAEQASREVLGKIGVVPDPELAKYVQTLGQKLARFAPPQPFAYRFQVIDQWSPNAFALPGGAIFVSRGLLVLSNSEDELAGVLAHEITHAAERHAATRQAFVEHLNPLSLGFVRAARVSAYARDQERAADMGGQRIAAAAGFDPRGLPEFLNSLARIERLQMGRSRIPTFLDTHPSNTERVAAATVFASTLQVAGERGSRAQREAYLKQLEGLVLGANPAEGVVVGSRFLHADLGIGVSFPRGWPIENTPAAVVALSPAGDARFALEDAGPGDDPQAAARAFAVQGIPGVQLVVDVAQPQELRCCRAFVARGRAIARDGVIAGQIAWIAHGGRIYRLSAASIERNLTKNLERARTMVQSFRPLTPEERAAIEIDRLHLTRARAGETIAAFSARTGNAYDTHRTAIANGLEVNARLDDGQLLKVGLRKPYRSEAGATPR